MLEVEAVSFAYDGTPVLSGVSTAFEPGEVVAVTGPNGAGKTTLAMHLNGLLEPDSGVVRLDGTPVTEDPVAARTAVGMVFQDPDDQFVAATVGEDVAFGPENLGLSREAIRSNVERALETVDMDGREHERIDRLSGGERARVAIAGVLAMAPEYILLDEPLAGLDRAARTAVLAHLEELGNAGTGVVVLTHDLRDVWSLADRVLALEQGEVVADGPLAANREAIADLAILPRC